MNVEFIPFKPIKDIWENYVWPDRKCVGVDDLQYLGGRVATIAELYTPKFYAIKENNIIRAACGGHRTSNSLYRIRGVFIDKNKDPEPLFKCLFEAVKRQAKSEGCITIWDCVTDNKTIQLYRSLRTIMETTRPSGTYVSFILL